MSERIEDDLAGSRDHARSSSAAGTPRIGTRVPALERIRPFRLARFREERVELPNKMI
jgi:hypothetical protein